MPPSTSARALFAQNLKIHRSRLGVSQVELSLAAGLGVNTVGNIEKKAPSVHLDTVNRLAISLDVDPCLLLLSTSNRALGSYTERPLDRAVADNIRRLRARLGLTQEQVASAAGLARNYVYKVESLNVVVTLNTLDALARALDVESWQLLS